MADVGDFFFSAYVTPSEGRRRAALHDGLAHGSQIRPRDPIPSEPVTLLFSANGSLPIEQVAVYYTTDGSEPSGYRGISAASITVLAAPDEMKNDPSLNLPVRHWRAVIPGQPEGTVVRYRADGWSRSDEQAHWYADNVDPVGMPPQDGRLFAYSVDRLQPPEWIHDAVVYQVFVDRFHAASDEPALHDPGSITGFFGGTLRGVLEKLDYIQSLGANCIWLSPVFESPTHHGYNPSDYYQVAKRYGTNQTLRDLIGAAHARNMRVLLDFVANHTSDEHQFFLDARANPQSLAARWYSFGDWPPYGYRAYARVSSMPELATERPEVQRYLIEAALYWLGSFGADGLRLDYVPGPTHAFWTIFQHAVKQQFPQALTLGEITASPAEIAPYAGRLDAFMDFSLAGMLRKVFAQRRASLKELLTFLDARAAQLAPELARATLLDNHDMHRFLWLAGGNIDRLKLAAACQMTLEGMPIIYYGTEVGLSQYGDAHRENAYARAPMLWDGQQDQTLLAYYRRLLYLRHTYPALRRGSRAVLPVEVMGASAPAAAEQVGAYLRWLDGQYLLVALNNTEEPVRLRIQLAGWFASLADEADGAVMLRDLLAGVYGQEYQVVDGRIDIPLPALGVMMLGRA